MATNEFRILEGLSLGHRAAMIRLFCDTFPEVIVPVFGSVERCAELLEQSLVTERVLVAVSGGRLVGFAGLHYSGQEWFDPSPSKLLRVMQWSTFRVLALGIVLFKRPKHDVLHLDTLAVHPDVRGRGIGTQLIEAAKLRAQAEGKQLITLEVEDINPRAKQLYERMGFSTAIFEKLPWPWSRAFAFSGSYYMSKKVTDVPRNDYSESASTTSKPFSK